MARTIWPRRGAGWSRHRAKTSTASARTCSYSLAVACVTLANTEPSRGLIEGSADPVQDNHCRAHAPDNVPFKPSRARTSPTASLSKVGSAIEHPPARGRNAEWNRDTSYMFHDRSNPEYDTDWKLQALLPRTNSCKINPVRAILTNLTARNVVKRNGISHLLSTNHAITATGNQRAQPTP